MLEALLVSTAVVALGELGDKTQLLALMLAARYGKPWPIVGGIFVATLVNHTIAGWVGNWVRGAVSPDILRWLLALSFFAVAAWALKPDKLDADDAAPTSKWGVFGVTAVAFFLAEIGDKTQVATVMLAAKFDSLVAVVTGTTLGMLIVDVPTVFIGGAAAARIPLRAVRIAAAALFAGLGLWVLLAP
ncbi:MAG: TMEM165/GDT1 family protein [Casimicrobiaceae bacterium]